MPTFINQATLSYNNTVINSNVVTGNVVEAVTATKTALVDTYSQGDRIAYVIVITNSGVTALSGITVDDDLGAYAFGTETLVPLTYVDGSLRYYLNGVLQPTPTIEADDTLTVSGISIPAGQTALLIYEAEANEFAPRTEGSSITNTVTIDGEGLCDTITASETVTPETEPSLTIAKSISPASVTGCGQEITYTFVIQNRGNEEVVATDNVVVTDTFNPVLSDIAVTYNDTVLTPGTQYTYEDGVFTTAEGVITVPAATFTQAEDGTWVITPGVSTITVTGTI